MVKISGISIFIMLDEHIIHSILLRLQVNTFHSTFTHTRGLFALTAMPCPSSALLSVSQAWTFPGFLSLSPTSPCFFPGSACGKHWPGVGELENQGSQATSFSLILSQDAFLADAVSLSNLLQPIWPDSSLCRVTLASGLQYRHSLSMSLQLEAFRSCSFLGGIMFPCVAPRYFLGGLTNIVYYISFTFHTHILFIFCFDCLLCNRFVIN